MLAYDHIFERCMVIRVFVPRQSQTCCIGIGVCAGAGVGAGVVVVVVVVVGGGGGGVGGGVGGKCRLAHSGA